jgi:N-acetylglucosaminyldiphosphoundecaprenol N-acetyl-beta-D-mannosaminyltransferase
MRAAVDTADVLGIPVAKLTLPELLERVRQAARAPGPCALRIAYVNAHSVNLFVTHPRYRQALLAADLIYADGNGPRLAARLAGDRLPPRMTGADWIHDLCRLAVAESLGLYFLGGAPGVAQDAARRLTARWPGLKIVGIRHGFFGVEERAELVREIGAARPHVVLLGMGSPRQEIWMAEFGAALGAPVVWAGGGVLDYASGRIRRAPRFMCRMWLEWLGRALIEPRRLGPRYLLGIPLFLWRAFTYGARRERHR